MHTEYVNVGIFTSVNRIGNGRDGSLVHLRRVDDESGHGDHSLETYRAPQVLLFLVVHELVLGCKIALAVIAEDPHGIGLPLFASHDHGCPHALLVSFREPDGLSSR